MGSCQVYIVEGSSIKLTLSRTLGVVFELVERSSESCKTSSVYCKYTTKRPEFSLVQVTLKQVTRVGRFQEGRLGNGGPPFSGLGLLLVNAKHVNSRGQNTTIKLDVTARQIELFK